MDIRISNFVNDLEIDTKICLLTDEGEVLYEMQTYKALVEYVREAHIEVKNLSPGKYYVWTDKNSSSNLEITTKIEGKASSRISGTFEGELNNSFYNGICGCQNEEPYFMHLGPYTLGNFNSDFYYSDSVKTTQDVFYEFTIHKIMDINITSYMDDYDTNSTVYLLLPNGKILYQDYISTSGNGKDKAILNIMELPPGKYFVWTQETGTPDQHIITSIEGKVSGSVGNSIQNPIFIGDYDTKFTFSDLKNTMSYTDEYSGFETNDIYHSITIGNAMDIVITHQAEFQTKIWLLSETGQLLKENSETSKQLSVRNLLPGTYYIVSEGIEENGEINIKITGNTFGPSQSHNYIHKQVPKTAISSTTTPSFTQVINTLEYYDGLGRPFQSIQMNATPSGGDLISSIEYDVFGRESKQWLPVSLSGNNGASISNQNISEFARGQYEDLNAYSQIIYEDSPLNRPLQQYGPGKKWKDNNKTVKISYLTNNNSNKYLKCYHYEVFDGGYYTSLSRSRDQEDMYYANGELFVEKTTGEGENISYEFKDKKGQIVLTRQINNGDLYDTYYVYDDFGNLCYVLPPLTANISNFSDYTSDELKEYAYLYKYDHRQRCIAKRLPGCDWIHYVYDNADNLIFSQDGEQRLNNEWAFAIPDVFGRPAVSGVCKNELYYEDKPLEDLVVKVETESSNGIYKGYNILGIELVEPVVLQVNFYDNYNFLDINGINNADYTPKPGYGTHYDNAKGMLTGNMIVQLDADNVGMPEYLYSVMYYDIRGRLVQTKSNNHLGGTEVEYIAYNFTGQPIKKMHIHNDGTGTIKEEYTYTYDHAGRLTETRHRLNDSNRIMATKNHYDELGRLSSTSRKVYQKATNP
ncbi:DUF6443 domain-containing protein [Dysgonomonas sp. 511]|uniref:DUF6443 domain-containing protein n=1 Tax=Dysgonomonas sp. 511 TaxID=2302930 RepID=UPI0013D49A88|nr:DUF6443 domain-containing protein [Dysgonomonas sp. 511]NDV79995.1 hypothetical protein [Dysgonomonas sp. 511]